MTVKILYEYAYKCGHVEQDRIEPYLHLKAGQLATCPFCKLDREIAKVFRTHKGERRELKQRATKRQQLWARIAETEVQAS